MTRFYSFLALLLCCNLASGQCPGAVNAGPDRFICFPGGSVNINGTATPGFTGILWTPSAGVSNPTIVNPSITVNGAGPHTFTLTGKYRMPGNLVVNGTFTDGNTGFTSDYVNASNLVPEGLYAIVTNPNSTHPGFAACGDHTTGTGNMMVVNGAGTPNLNVWCQTIPVIPNTEYQFETWVTSVAAGSPALLQFSINGGTIGPIFQAPNTVCVWQRFSATWNSGANTTADICIVNQNTALGGNDFAIDDIAFNAICTVSDEMTIFVREKAVSTLDTSICFGNSIMIGNATFSSPINQEIKLAGAAAGGCDSFVQLNLDVIELEVDVQQPDQLNCYNLMDGVPLYGEVLNYPASDIIYKWINENGQIISNTNSAQAFTSGTYTLKVIYTGHAPPCAGSNVSVFVDIDTVAPIALVGADLKLGCAGGNLVIDGSQSTDDPFFSYVWSTNGGHFVSGQNTLTPVVDSAGSYILLVIDPINGCEDRDTINILPNTGLPTVLISAPTPLNCLQDSVILDASGSDQGSIYIYAWSTPNGNILSGDSTLNPVINAPGTYILTIIDTTGPCQNQSNITVNLDTLLPVAEAGLPDTLDCQVLQLSLNGNNSSTGPGYIYQWTGPGIVGKTDSIQALVNLAGVYFLHVTNSVNGCVQVDSVSITQNAVPPISDAGPDSVLTCLATELYLNGANTSTGNQISYHWTTLNGSIPGNPDSIAIGVIMPGSYVLIVTDQSNDCVISDTVEIFQNLVKPAAEAGASQTLNCGSTSLNLDGTGSSTGAQYGYLWENVNSGVVGGETTLTPAINKSGWYILTVIDSINGCTTIDSVEILKDNNVPTVLIVFPDTLDCLANTIQIDASGSSNGPNLLYTWTTANGGNIISGNGTLTPTVNAAGTYILTIKDQSNNCTETDEVIVALDTISPNALIQTPLPLNCKNISILLDASQSTSGPQIQYTWKDENGNIIPGLSNQIYVTQTGDYTVELLNTENGCTSSFTIPVISNVNGPGFQTLVSPDTITCITSNVPIQANANGSDLVYTLQDMNGVQVSKTTPNSWLVGLAGNYTSVVLDTLTGCSDTMAVSVAIDTIRPIIDPSKSNELDCKTNLASLQTASASNPAYSFTWNTVDGHILGGSNTNMIQVDQGGTYDAVVQNISNGCINTLSIFLEDPEKPSGQIAVLIPLCPGDLGTLNFESVTDGLPPYVYSIDGGITFQSTGSFDLLPPGNYQGVIRDSAFCTFTLDIDIPDPVQIELSADSVISIIKGSQVNVHIITNLALQDIKSIVWSPAAGLSCADCLDPIITGIENTIYTVTVTDQNGCTQTIQIDVRVKVNPSVFTPNGFSPDGDGNNDFFNLFGNSEVAGVNSLTIFNRWGDLLAEYKDLPINDPNVGWDGKFKGKDVQPGVYVYLAEVLYKNGKTEIFSGDVLIGR